jgi:hypothetical protein
MANRIVLAAVLCAGVAGTSLPFAAASADEATTSAAAPSLDLVDQPASDEDLKKESGSAVQSVAGNNSSGLPLPAPAGEAVGTAPSFDNAGSSAISTSNSLTAISTLSATVDSNGFQN